LAIFAVLGEMHGRALWGCSRMLAINKETELRGGNMP
jgi:hypothetical protein